MQGANIFIMWAQTANNVTLSPRLGKGEFEPVYPSASAISLLEGTGISNGVLTAIVRCDNCLTWEGGSMDPTSGNSRWIWSIRKGNPINSSDASITTLKQHDTMGTFTFDLVKAKGGNSLNPFVNAAGSPTIPVSRPSTTASSSGARSGASDSSSGGTVSDSIRRAHAIIMSIVFLILFPIGAMTIYLPLAGVATRVHAPLQLLSLLLGIAGLGLGAYMASKLDETDEYHPVIGILVIATLFIIQPLLGILQHRHFKQHHSRSLFGHAHRGFGRMMIILGIINGGLGFKLSGVVGSEDVPKGGVIAYSVVAASIFLLWVAVMILGAIRGRRQAKTKGFNGVGSQEKVVADGNGAGAYQMNNMARSASTREAPDDKAH